MSHDCAYRKPMVKLTNAAGIWRNREDAAAGGQGPWHKKARAAAREMYESISFHTHKLVIEGGAEKWQLEEYVD